jgi:F-type H+-transporting ATPase subunit epsilon
MQRKKSFNKYSQITARAVRQSLKETERLAAERRGQTSLRYQHWEDGKGGEQVSTGFSQFGFK